jgi:hypothetical protein
MTLDIVFKIEVIAKRGGLPNLELGEARPGQRSAAYQRTEPHLRNWLPTKAFRAIFRRRMLLEAALSTAHEDELRLVNWA